MEVSGQGAPASVSGELGTTDGSTGNTPSGEKPTPTQAPNKVKVKSGDYEAELTVEELARDYQLKEASNRKFKEAAKIEQKANAIIEALHKGDLEFVRKNVPKESFKKLATDYLLDELEWDSLPEGEKRRIQAEKELSEYKRKEAERTEAEAKAKQTQEYEAYRQEAQKNLASTVNEVIEMHKAKGLPVDHGYLLRSVDLMIAAHHAGQKISAAQAFEAAVGEMNGVFDKRFKAYSPEDLMKTLSPEQLKGINRLLIGNAKNIQSQPRQKSGPVTTKKGAKVGIDEFFNHLENKFGG